MKLVIDDVVYEYAKIFGDFGEILALPGRDITAENVQNCDILIIRSRTKINRALLQNSNVRFVGSTVAGLDHIDLDYLHKNNIQLFSAQGCNAMAVAEFIISACVNLAAEFKFDLRQKTLGVIGVGNVGSRLATKANLLGIKTLLNDPLRQASEHLPDFVDLNTALSADIVSFHTPLTFAGARPSHHLLNRHNFKYVQPNAIIFNAARGGIIDEQIWQQTRTLANVIDCWEDEPNISQPLQQSAYWATPHIAGHSVDAKFMGSFMVYEALCDHLNIAQNPAIVQLIKPQKISIEQPTLLTTLNAIYDFKRDSLAIENPENFEHYRRFYPKRYEWQHFNSTVKLPIA